MSKKPTEKFAFDGNFKVGGGQAGEDNNAVKVCRSVLCFATPARFNTSH